MSLLEFDLVKFDAVPISHGTLVSLLKGYRRPNDKISEWLKNGTLILLKRGLYLVNEPLRHSPICLPLIANQIYGPSCVSLDYALSIHGLIPERVKTITSVTPRRSRQVNNSIARFSYQTVPSRLFSVGILNYTENGFSYLMASPEKAICDKLLLTRQLQITNKQAMKDFLLEDLRFDISVLSNFNFAIIHQYRSIGIKAKQFDLLELALEDLL